MEFAIVVLIQPSLLLVYLTSYGTWDLNCKRINIKSLFYALCAFSSEFSTLNLTLMTKVGLPMITWNSARTTWSVWPQSSIQESFYRAKHYSAKRGLAIACRLSVCPSICLSVTLVDHDHIGWKSWKLIARTLSPTSSLFVAQRSSNYSRRNMDKFGGENVRSTPTSIMSGWIESTESHVILGGGVAVCLYFCRRIVRLSLR